MATSYTLMSHFESGLGVAVRGILPQTTVTIFKLANDLQKCFISRGEILENLDSNHLCRTQIRIKMVKDVSYFLTEPLGNHHIIVLGDYVEKLEKYFMEL
jgi:L-fucose isomerase-like protein